ncbi:MAG: hypothetical protein N2314_02585 [Brevinematales bacterium]|nr:hypothetical protein [Brevinematales bacterium]
METIQKLLSLIKGLADVFSFLLFTWWGWGILASLILLLVFKQGISGDGTWRWSVFLLNLSEKCVSLVISLPQIVMGILVIFIIATFGKEIQLFSENLRLIHQKEILNQTLKNLRFEGKILEIKVDHATNGYALTLFYYTHSPWQNTPILRSTQRLFTTEKRVYVDFGVCNFDYALIAEGNTYNLAFPARLYTETISPEKGYTLFSGEKGILWSFDIPDEDLVGIDAKDFRTMGQQIVSAITNATIAKKLGIRTFYGQAIAVDLIAGKTYQFVTTGTGGVKLLP